MNPSAEAALISGGWATVVGALGYWFNRATARATIQATNANATNALDAGHQAQLWEKRAEAYVDAMTAIERRRAKRDFLAAPVQIHDEATQQRMVQEAFAAPKDDDWARISARVSVYTTPMVRHALEQAAMADHQMNVKMIQHKSLIERLHGPSASVPTGEQIMAAFEAIQAAAEMANTADADLATAMQVDLERRPSIALAGLPGQEPAEMPPDRSPGEIRRRWSVRR